MPGDWRFRPLLEIDFERQWRWLNEPHVIRRWSRKPLSREQVRAKYLPRVQGRERMHCLVAILDGRAAGYVQAYPVAEYAGYAAGFVLPPDGWALDWFIGEPRLLGKGHGARLIDSFVRQWLWERAEPRYAVTGAALDNVAGLKSLERALFTPWFSTLPQKSAERYYRRDRKRGEGWINTRR